jgi:hypothetical protein
MFEYVHDDNSRQLIMNLSLIDVENILGLSLRRFEQQNSGQETKRFQ